MGLKKSNGGAVTIICNYLNNYDLKDRYSTSRVSAVNTTGKPLNITKQMVLANLTKVTDLINSSKTYSIYREAVFINNSIFDSNYVGLVGSAINLRNIS